MTERGQRYTARADVFRRPGVTTARFPREQKKLQAVIADALALLTATEMPGPVGDALGT